MPGKVYCLDANCYRSRTVHEYLNVRVWQLSARAGARTCTSTELQRAEVKMKFEERRRRFERWSYLISVRVKSGPCFTDLGVRNSSSVRLFRTRAIPSLALDFRSLQSLGFRSVSTRVSMRIHSRLFKRTFGEENENSEGFIL